MIALESHGSAVYDVFSFQVATEVVTEVSKLNNVTSQQLTGQRHPLEPPFPQPRSSSRQHQQKTFYNKLTQTSKQVQLHSVLKQNRF